jgi:hypothetical protein
MAEKDDEIARLIEEAELLHASYEPYSVIADHCGVDHKTARKKLEAAGLKPNAANHWPLADSIRALCADRDPGFQLGKALRGEGSAAVAMGGQTKLALLAEAKAEEARLRAQALRVKVEKASGDLISRRAVIQAVESSAIMTRDAFRGLPLRLAPKLIGAGSAEQIAIILEEAIDETLATAALSAEQIIDDAIS